MRSLWWGALALGAVACNDDDDGDGDGADTDTDGADTDTDGEAPQWTVLGDENNLPASAFLSIWMSSVNDVWLVGSDDGTGPAVLHYDGTAWSRLDTGTSGDLWWVWSDGGDVVWVSGAEGRVLTYTRSTEVWEQTVITSNAYTMFGVWGTSNSNVWSVGGDNFGNLDGVVLHNDGAGWVESTLATPPADGVGHRQAFKVWGAAADDVWVVGTRVLLMHTDGVTWTDVEDPFEFPGSTTTLTTVHGSSANWVVAVGGPGNARAITYDGAAWSDVTPQPSLGGPIVPNINGVFAPQDGRAVVCGDNGSIWWIEGTTWTVDEHERATTWHYHACWVDENDAVWAVGGDLTNRTEGFIIYGGDAVPTIAL